MKEAKRVSDVLLTDHAGRTGRAGKLGTAITFLANDDDEVMCVEFSLSYANVLMTFADGAMLWIIPSGTTSSKVRPSRTLVR